MNKITVVIKLIIVCILLGAFVKLPLATVSFVMPTHMSAWNDWAPTGRIFVKFDVISGFFENRSTKFRFR